MFLSRSIVSSDLIIFMRYFYLADITSKNIDLSVEHFALSTASAVFSSEIFVQPPQGILLFINLLGLSLE
jgi:hypothetical protein